MKVYDIVHNFPDSKTLISRGICRVRSFISPSGTVILLTDLGSKNYGLSVTNAVGHIIKSLIEQGMIIGTAIFIEHYEQENPEEDTFDIVKIHEGARPEWKSITREDVMKLVACEPDELNDRSTVNRRILIEADRIRYHRDPFFNSTYPDSPNIIKRRTEIVENMISRADIENLIYSGAGEQAIQRLLKNDLSVFGEVYGKPDDEYICFSEFPVADGFADFAVFTGRSRMDVVLVEVKGSEFNLINKNHYQGFNHKINQAADQIRNRIGYVYRDYHSFRDNLHSIRKRVEGGEELYNCFLGPINKLGVCSEKDINIRTVVIGGRTKNDIEESAKRHDYESRFSPPIRIESWDTWLRRLQRQ